MKKKITLAIISFFLLLTEAEAQLTVTMSASPNDTICQGQTVTFNSIIGGCAPPFQVNWYVNGNTMQSQFISTQTASFIFGSANPGDCIVIVVQSPAATCIPYIASDTICLFVVPNQPPSVSINALLTNPVCVGSLVVFTATPIDAGGSCATYTWYVDGVPSPSSTTAIFNYISLTAGVHTIYCEVHSCDTCDLQPPVNNPTAASNMIIVNVVVCTGISETETNSSVIIYPNPTEGKINLQWENPSGVECEIFISDYIGKTISEFRTDKNSLSIEDAALKSGIYFVTIKAGEKLFRSPVVVY